MPLPTNLQDAETRAAHAVIDALLARNILAFTDLPRDLQRRLLHARGTMRVPSPLAALIVDEDDLFAVR